MALLVIIFGLLSGCLLSILVGLVGRNRNIGFGWAFILSLILTPFIGLLITLISDQKDPSADKGWGCLGYLLGIIGFIFLITAILIFISIGGLAAILV